jgi:hypothetical protein
VSGVAPEAQTPLPIIALVSRLVTRACDQVTGDRSDYPLLVAGACTRALGFFGIESHVLFGHAAWIEVLENHSVIWAQSTESAPHFWVETEYRETVDLNTSVAYRRRTREKTDLKASLSPPLLWSKDVPSFYRFHAEGAAEIAPTDARDLRWWKKLCDEIEKNCAGKTLPQLESLPLEFPNEPMICPGRKLLDDSEGSFKHFDRALTATGLPKAPF